MTLLSSAANRSYEEEANQRLDKEMEDSEMRRHSFQTFPISSCASFRGGTGDPQTLTGEGAPSTRFETRSFEESLCRWSRIVS